MRPSSVHRFVPALVITYAITGLSVADTAHAGTNQFSVVNSGFSAYSIDGQQNPSLTLTRGQTYSFFVNASGHPFWIKSIQGNTSANGYNNGVTGNGTSVGPVTFNVPFNAPDTLFYNCQNHSAMTGTINIIGEATLFGDGFE